MNALEQYFADHPGENLNRLAARIGCAASTLSRPIAGKRNPSVTLATKVEETTGGAVSAQEFIAICIAAARAARGSRQKLTTVEAIST
ncbi:helix-turn-helix transcriptional regulator [Bosea sp. TWI1241]|uniref:helix-turn-helix transcriptional regulator n=1 Tax=Bosea sp. TWI1241 TaxID=3148904 RepID=UPI00320A54E2